MIRKCKLILLLLFLSFQVFYLNAQTSIRDSSINMSIIGLNYSLYQTDKDMGNSFGLTSMSGISYSFKFSNNFILSASFDFLFGSDVKEDDILDELKTSKGYLLNSQGLMEPIALEERGYFTSFKIGKLFPVLSVNPNSGIFVNIGAGFIQHKIFFNYNQNYIDLPQIQGDYLKGYDRLTNGLALSQEIGYYHFANNNLGSFHFAFTVIEGFTQNRRDWNFDEFSKDTKKRLDLLYGFKIGLDIPVYNRVPDDFYIY